MAYTTPTIQEIVDRIEADFLSRIENSTSFLKRSILKVMAKVYGAVVFGLYGYLDDTRKQIFATSADGDNLLVQGNEYGIPKKAASYSTGFASGTGSNAKIIDAGKKVKSATGAIYSVLESVTIASGIFTVELQADLPGISGNEDGGAQLTFVSPIDGVSTVVTVDADGLTGGVDEESDDDYRERVLERKRVTPQGGAHADYERWALEYPGVTRAWAFDRYYGLGTIGLAYVMDDADDIIPTSAQMDLVKSYIESHTDPITGKIIGMPVTAQLIMIDLSFETVNLTVGINPNNSVVQANIISNLEDLLIEAGGPGETIELSKFTSAIAAAAGEDANKIYYPTDDMAFATNKIPVLGTVTFQDY